MQAPTFQFTIKFFLMSNNMPEKRAYLFFLKKKSSDQRLSANQILAITNFKLYGIFIAKKKKHCSCSHISPWAHHAIFIFILVIKLLF
jgi:hypothetical protein